MGGGTGPGADPDIEVFSFMQEVFDDFVIRSDIIGFSKEPIKLKSGRYSNWYANWRKVTNDAFLTELLARFVIAFTEDNMFAGKLIAESNIEKPDTFYGVPAGATKLAVLTQYLWASKNPDWGPGEYALSIGREMPKDHGKPEDKFFVGMPKGKTIIIEDVTTTGGSLERTINSLREADVDIMAAYGLFNRMENRDDGRSVQEVMKALDVPYFHLSSALNLLPKAYQKLKPGEEIKKSIEEEFEKYGAAPLKL